AHRVARVLQPADLAAPIDGDLARQITTGDGSRHIGDIAHLIGQVAAHRIDRVGQILPGPSHTGHQSLAAELALGANLARDARHFRREGAQLVYHRIDGFLELQDLAADIDGDLLRQVAACDGYRYLGDVANLRGQVACHRVNAFGQVLPDAAHFADLRLAAELAIGADLPGNARDFGGEHAQLLDHRVDDVRGTEELAL